MRRELMLKAARGILPGPDLDQQPRVRAGAQSKDTKTTIVALRYRDGIMCAADRKVSGGYYIHDQDFIKMWRVSPNSVMLGCGSIGDIQAARDMLREHCFGFHRAFGHAVSIQGQATMLARWCRWMSAWSEMSMSCLLAGRNRDGQFHIIGVEESGSRMTFDRFSADGSGGPNATIVLDRGWKPDMDAVQARQLAVEAIFHAANRDSGSSPVQVALPTLVTVTESGIAKVTDKEVMEITAQVLLDKLGISVDLARAIERQRRRRP